MIDIRELQESDQRLSLELISKKEIFDFVKRNSNYFNKELMGIRLDKKSRLLQQKLPEIILNQIKQDDKIAIKFISINLHKQLSDINAYLEKQLESDDSISEIIHKDKKIRAVLPINYELYIKYIIEEKEQKNYIKLVNILLQKLKPQYIMLYFRLNKIELKPRQKKLMELSLEEVIKYNEIKQKVYEEEQQIIAEKIRQAVEKEHLLLENEKTINQNLKDKLRDIEKSIKEEEKIINEKVKEIEREKRTSHDLRAEVEKLNRQNNNINKTIEKIKISHEENLKNEISKRAELEEKIKERDILINNLNKSLEERYESYSHKYSLRWQEENNEKLIKEKKISHKIHEMENTVDKLHDEIINLELEKEKVKKKLDKYNDLLVNFMDNIDEEFIKSTLRSSIFHIKKSDELGKQNTNLYVRAAKREEQDDITICKEIDEFSDLLSDNFKKAGVAENRDDLSYYIVSALASKMIPLITGYKTREIAKAISYSYSGEAPLIITLPTGYSNASELIDIYNNCEEKVILIEGVIGELNEAVIMPLFKEYAESGINEKIILISSEDEDMVKLVPLYLFEYIAVVNISKIKPVIKYEYLYGDSVESLQSLKEDDLDINSSYKKLNKLFKGLDFNKSYVMSRMLMLSYLCKILNEEKALECLIKCDIKSILNDKDMQNKMVNNIENYINDFSFGVKELIEGEYYE